MENQIVNVPLTSIKLSETNEVLRGRITKVSLSDLANSINEVGVIQPVTVRPILHSEEGFTYELVIGERRVRACKIAGMENIPAMIRDLSDDMALIVQITENIQRQDVHPLHECEGYKLILEKDNTQTAATLATTFGKSESYVLKRLKLDDLIPGAKKDFLANKMNIGHAMILSRLSAEDQHELIESLSKYRGGYTTVPEMERYVDSHFRCTLSNAPFDLNDAELYEKAGACMSCPKRSGTTPLLFSEVKEKDQCYDKDCFRHKVKTVVLKKTIEIINTEPGVALIRDYSSPSDEVNELVKSHNIKVLKENDDFSPKKNDGEKSKGLWLSGERIGHITTIFIKQHIAETITVDDKIAKIQQRVTRFRELDKEKVYAKIVEAITNHPSQNVSFNKKMTADEEAFLWFVIFDKASYSLKRDFLKLMRVSDDQPEKIYNGLKKLKPETKAYMLRRLIIDQYSSNNPASTYGTIIYHIAQQLKGIDVPSFEKEQKEIRHKREANAKAKIKILQQEIK
jgi:ParB/RepB/Spo0J family partition protein